MSGPSASGSVVPTSAFDMPALAKPVHFAAGSIRDLIATALEIPEHLIDRKKGGDIRVAYVKYLALREALDTLSTLSASGTWKQKNTNDDVIEVFVAKSGIMPKSFPCWCTILLWCNGFWMQLELLLILSFGGMRSTLLTVCIRFLLLNRMRRGKARERQRK